MDDIEVYLMEMQQEFDEIMVEWDQEDRKKPSWWLIALGSEDAPRASYDASCKIYKSFKKFSFMHKGKDFFELIDLFTMATIQNRLNI